MGLLNTLTDVTLFMLLQGHLGIVLANLVSTSAGMTLSFVANGLFTFGAERLSARQAVLFVVTNALTLWVIQPALIHAVLAVTGVVLVSKVVAVGCCVCLNFVAYRWVVWPAPAGHPRELEAARVN